VAVDARFGAMFGKGKKGDKMAKDFNIISKVDKYGRKNRVEDKQVYENFYQIEKDEEDPLQKKYYDAEGKFKWEQESSSQSSQSSEEEVQGADWKHNDESSEEDIATKKQKKKRATLNMNEASEDEEAVWSVPEISEDEQPQQEDV